MAIRYTENALRHDIAAINRELADSASAYFYKVCPRNNYCAVDIYEVDALGKKKILREIECGTPKECLETVRDQFRSYYGQPAEALLKTALTAYAVIHNYLKLASNVDGMKLEPNFDSLDGESKALVGKWRNSCVFTGTDKDFYEVLQDIDKSAELSRNAQSGQSKSI